MEVLNVPADKEELVALALEDVLKSEESLINYSTKYLQKRESLLVCFTNQHDKEVLRRKVKELKVEDTIYKVSWMKMEKNLSSGESACLANLVEVLDVTDQDLVCEYFRDILGKQPECVYEEKQNRLLLYLQSDKELSLILEVERPDVDEHGPVRVTPVVESTAYDVKDAFIPGQDKKYSIEVVKATDEDIVMDYVKGLIKRMPSYQYFAEGSRIVLTVESQAECDQLLFKENHYIDALEETVSFRKLLSPSRGLKVSGIPTTVSEKYLNVYFKNEENGGGAIKKLTWDAANGVATIFYNEDEVAERVFKKPRHEIRNVALTLEIVEESIMAEETKRFGVKVSEIPKEVSHKYLSVYFAKDINGGGAIRKLDWDPGNGIATIFFCDDNVAKSVASKCHKFRNVESKIQLIEEEEASATGDTTQLPTSNAAPVETVSELATSPTPAVDSQVANQVISHENAAAGCEVSQCLAVYGDNANVLEIKSNIKKTWQIQDGEYELEFNPSECIGIVRVTTTAGKLDEVLTNPQKNSVVFEKYDGEAKTMLGDVHVLIEQISAETSREAVWSWLKVVTRCAAHTIYYSDVLPSNCMNAVALISFHEGLELETSVARATDYKYAIDNHSLCLSLIRAPMKLVYMNVPKKIESAIKRELQLLLSHAECDNGMVEDVEVVGEHAVVALSSKKAFRHLLAHTSRLGCKSVLPYYEQLGSTANVHVFDYSALCARISRDLPTGDIKRAICPRLIVTVRGGTPREDILRKFFADRSASAGDKSASLCSNADGSFVVTFDDPQAADRVYQKYQHEGLKIGSLTLSVVVRGMRETSNSSENQVLVRNIGLASEDSIKYFLWALANTGVTRLTFVRDPHDGSLCARARFQRAIDHYRLAYFCEGATLDNTQLSVEPVPEPNAVILHNVPRDADKQLVKYCFEPENVADCVEQENGTWIIYFKSQEYAACALEANIVYGDAVNLSAEPFSQYRTDTSARKKGMRGLHKISCDWASFEVVDFIKKWKQHEFDHLVKETEVVCDFSEDKHLFIQFSGSVTADRARLVEEKFRSFLNEYGFWQIDVLPDLWNDLLRSNELVEIQRLEKSVLHMEAFDFDQSKSACRIVLVGRSDIVQNTRQQIEKAIKFISDERERQKQRTCHTETYSPCVAKLLMAGDVHRKLMTQHADLVVAFDDSVGTCRLEGFPSDVKRSLDHINSMASSIAHESCDVSLHVSGFMERETITSHINAKLSQENLMPGVLWFLPRSCVFDVYGLHADEVRRAVQLIRGEIHESSIDLGETIESVINNEKWKDCTDAICGRRNGDVVITPDLISGSLHVVCKAGDSAAVLEEINNFTRRNLIKTTFMKLPRIQMKLLTSTLSFDIQNLEKLQSRNHVRLSPRLSDYGECGFHIEGNADGIINIQRIINDFLNKQQKVITKQHVVRRPGAESFFSSRPSALQDIGSKSKTYVEVHDPNAAVESQREESNFEFPIPGGVVVSVKMGSITDLECDVIVNPSNGELQHAGGLAEVIANLGGAELVQECENYIRQNGNLPEGQACITSAGKGKLRCKKVVHAVGPRWQGGNRNEVNKLFQTVTNSLYLVEQLNLTSVAIPPISSGIFCYPLEKSTSTIVESVMSYCETKKGSLSQVTLIDVNDEGVRHFRRALNRMLGKESSPDRKESRPRGITAERATAGTHLSSGDSSEQTFHRSAVELQDISIEVLREDICSQQADVIVSTIGQDLELSKGYLSKLLLNAAGNGMEQELKKNYKPPVRKGNFVVTEGYRLNCRKVYHVCCPEFDSSQGDTQVQDIALRILNEINDQKMSSVVFPAIGTGNLGHPVEAVARQLYLAVQSFVQCTKRPALKKVKFVLVNDDSFKIFQECHRKILSGEAQPRNNAPGTTQTTGRAAAFAYEESNSRKPKETVPDSESDSTDRKKFTVKGVKIEVVRGDITDERTTIIVNCSDDQLSLNSQVSRSICRKGGSRISEECKRKKSIESIRSTGLFLSSAGNLACNYVLHVNASMSNQDIISTCLQRAEEEEAESIAFPAIGTGSKRSSAADVAPALIEAVLAFTNNGNCHFLTNIRFVVIDEDTAQDFQNVLEASLNPRKQSFLQKMGSKIKSFWQGDASSSPVPRDYQKSRPEIISLDDVEDMDDIDEANFEIVLDVCGGEKNTDAAIRLIEELCTSELKLRRISEEPNVIAQLADHEVQKYVKVGNLLGVSIDVQRASRVIILQSMDDSALSKANGIIMTNLLACKVSSLDKQASERDEHYSLLLEEQLSKVVQWQYRTTSSSKWCDYPKLLNRKLEEHASKPSLKYGPSANSFFVDLVKFVDSSENNLDEEATVRRRDLTNPVPETWDSVDKDYLEVTIDVKSAEFIDVTKEFESTLGGRQTKIIQITRVQNRPMYLQYIHQKERITSTMLSKTIPIERRLWHGTSEDAVKFICNSGFNRSYCGKNNTLYGEGVYFARSSAMAAQDSYSQPNSGKEKFVILASVLTGDYDVGTKGMRVPSKKSATSLCTYDTTVDDYDNPAIFVTYNDCQAYPLYVIKFT